MLGSGSAHCAASAGSCLAQKKMAWCVSLAALLLGWLAFARRRSFRQGSSSLERTAHNCILRIVATSVAATWLPACSAVLLPGEISAWVNPEALFLAALQVLLPLPLKHHLWVQALALRSALARMRQVASVAACLPGQAAMCARFARCARLALLAFVPGGDELHPALLPEHACWMFNVWIVAVVGYLLPSAVLAALTRHATWVQQQRQRQRQQRQRQRQRAPIGHRDSGTAGMPRKQAKRGGTASSLHVPKPEDSPSPSGVLDGSEPSSSGSESESEGHGSESEADGSRVSSRRLLAQLPPGYTDSEMSSLCGTPHPTFLGSKAPRPFAPGPLSRLPHLASQLAFTWLPLLLPSAALLWAALEVAVQLLHM